jgi:hypothetical protein
MELTSTRTVPAPLEATWAALNDPETLKACLPGCGSFERSGEARVALEPQDGGTRIKYTVKAQVGGKLAQIGSRLIDGAAARSPTISSPDWSSSSRRRTQQRPGSRGRRCRAALAPHVDPARDRGRDHRGDGCLLADARRRIARWTSISKFCARASNGSTPASVSCWSPS